MMIRQAFTLFVVSILVLSLPEARGEVITFNASVNAPGEPGTLGLLVAGGWALLRRRR